MISESDAAGRNWEGINVVAAGSVFRCPSCGSLFSAKDTQTSSRSPTDIILIVSAALLAVGLGYALLSFLGFNLPFAFSDKG